MTDRDDPSQDRDGVEGEKPSDLGLEAGPQELAPEGGVGEPHAPEGEGQATTGELPAEIENSSEPEQTAKGDTEPSDSISQQQEADHAVDNGFLEEAFYPSTSSEVALEVGSEHMWGDMAFTVEVALPKGWYRARQHAAPEPILVLPQPQHELWSQLPRHPLLPPVLYSGPEGLAVAYAKGEAVALPVTLKEALGHVLALAKLVRFFEVQQQAVLHIDPDGLLLTDTGLRLRYPPRLAPIGDPLPDFYREGYTAPEVRARATATGKEGVYVLAALLLQLLTGKPPPPEGPSLSLLSDVKVPGLPQLVSSALASERIGVEDFMRSVKALKELIGLVRPVFQLGAATTVGLNPERPVNEDSYGYVYEVVESYGGLSRMLRACVADGMGGEAAGELASRAAVETFCRETPSRPLDTVEAQIEWTLQLGWNANKAVLEALSGQEGGCTLTGIILIGNQLSLAHVGDTRAYLVNEQGFAPLTKDHSLVNALLANGMITVEEAQTSPDRNKILRSLGSIRQHQEGYIESLEPMRPAPAMTLAAGDIIVLVSDGVWGEVNDERMRAIGEQHAEDPQALAEALVDEALQAGAPDNATALVVRRIR